jgi:hypothetical protein
MHFESAHSLVVHSNMDPDTHSCLLIWGGFLNDNSYFVKNISEVSQNTSLLPQYKHWSFPCKRMHLKNWIPKILNVMGPMDLPVGCIQKLINWHVYTGEKHFFFTFYWKWQLCSPLYYGNNEPNSHKMHLAAIVGEIIKIISSLKRFPMSYIWFWYHC